jgi:16S rRNA (adenine1518-N6/adenine1519-N6)-dimethyltransferase
VRARKRFGQHFLEDVWVRKVVAAVAPEADDVILEIGPGAGALTLPIARSARLVIGVELDRDLAADLPADAPPNVRVVQGDILEVEFARVLPPSEDAHRIRVVGNLPYNISSPILFRLLEAHDADPRISDATVMLQKEVADRLVAAPGTRDYGVLTVLLGRCAKMTHLLTLPPGAFRPPPKVTSAVVRLDFLAADDVTAAPPNFEAMVRALFTRRRKTLGNALAAHAGLRGSAVAQLLTGIGIDPRRRPETLTIPEFTTIAERLRERTGNAESGGERGSRPREERPRRTP